MNKKLFLLTLVIINLLTTHAYAGSCEDFISKFSGTWKGKVGYLTNFVFSPIPNGGSKVDYTQARRRPFNMQLYNCNYANNKVSIEYGDSRFNEYDARIFVIIDITNMNSISAMYRFASSMEGKHSGFGYLERIS
jgi:hypothetical protein